MKTRIGKASLVAALLLISAGPSLAGTLWYNGDFDGFSGLANQRNGAFTDTRVYDDFIVPSGGWHIDTVWSNNFMSPGDLAGTTAHWEIRSGMSPGNGGIVIASGDSAATQTNLLSNVFGFYDINMVTVSGLNVNLVSGTYWLTVAPSFPSESFTYVATTSGANAVGSPPGNNGNSLWDSTDFGANFADTAGVFDGFTPDFSMGVAENGSAVPEPGSLIMWAGMALLGLAAVVWQRKRSQPVMS